MEYLLSNNHVVLEDYRQRMTTKEWKICLLQGWDSLIKGGHVRQLKAKNLGCGVVEVYKLPLK